MAGAILLTILAGYLLGNLNGAVITSRLLGKTDVREQGSGNAGLTNFLRMYGPMEALLVVMIDMAKAAAACLLGKLLLEPHGYGYEGLLLGGLAVSLGHDFPALLGFKGGKGVLSGFTVALVVDWQCALLILAVFAVSLWLTRYVSLSSILGALTFSVAFSIRNWRTPLVAAMGAAIGLLIVVMHRGNISRLVKGTEKKATFSKFRRKAQ